LLEQAFYCYCYTKQISLPRAEIIIRHHTQQKKSRA
jgi:hypothetical protein